ncbi:MAG: hypothetical protein QW535_02685 [Candidatus Nezhaarchaeales archaeon]
MKIGGKPSAAFVLSCWRNSNTYNGVVALVGAGIAAGIVAAMPGIGPAIG